MSSINNSYDHQAFIEDMNYIQIASNRDKNKDKVIDIEQSLALINEKENQFTKLYYTTSLIRETQYTEVTKLIRRLKNQCFENLHYVNSKRIEKLSEKITWFHQSIDHNGDVNLDTLEHLRQRIENLKKNHLSENSQESLQSLQMQIKEMQEKVDQNRSSHAEKARKSITLFEELVYAINHNEKDKINELSTQLSPEEQEEIYNSLSFILKKPIQPTVRRFLFTQFSAEELISAFNLLIKQKKQSITRTLFIQKIENTSLDFLSTQITPDITQYILSFTDAKSSLVCRKWNQLNDVAYFFQLIKSLQNQIDPEIWREILQPILENPNVRTNRQLYIELKRWSKNFMAFISAELGSFLTHENIEEMKQQYLGMTSNGKILSAVSLYKNISSKNHQGRTQLWFVNAPEDQEKYSITWMDTLIPQIKIFIKLTDLTLDKQSLTSIPKEIYGLSHLRELKIIHCDDLESLPDGLAKCTWLTHFVLESRINKFPTEVFQLSNLKSLDIEYQDSLKLSELPNLRNLKQLKINYCNLKTFPNEILSLKELDYLNLTGNPISSLPPEIAKLTNLRCLILSDITSLTELPDELDQLNLQELFINILLLKKIPSEFFSSLNLCKLKFALGFLTHIAALKFEGKNQEAQELFNNLPQELQLEFNQKTYMQILEYVFKKLSTHCKDDGTNLKIIFMQLTSLLNFKLRKNLFPSLSKKTQSINRHFKNYPSGKASEYYSAAASISMMSLEPEYILQLIADLG